MNLSITNRVFFTLNIKETITSIKFLNSLASAKEFKKSFFYSSCIFYIDLVSLTICINTEYLHSVIGSPLRNPVSSIVMLLIPLSLDVSPVSESTQLKLCELVLEIHDLPVVTSVKVDCEVCCLSLSSTSVETAKFKDAPDEFELVAAD